MRGLRGMCLSEEQPLGGWRSDRSSVLASRGGSFSESAQSIALFINVPLKLKCHLSASQVIVADRFEVHSEKHAS